MTDLLNIGLSGLNSNRIGLSVTGQNITNVNTEGYSRQSVEFGARTPEFLGGFFLGTGAEVDTVRRITNEFMVASERSDISSFGKAETFSTVMDQMDQLFSNADSGLSGDLSSFYSSLQSAVDDPSSIEARQVFLSTANNLAQKFQGLQDQLLTLQNNIGQQVEAVVVEVSTLAKEVGELNNQINVAINSGGEPNDLLDQRDQALRDLSKLVDVRVVPMANNGVSISIGSGQPLVVGTDVFSLTTQVDPDNAAVRELAIQTDSGAKTVVGNSLGGGMLGGLLDAQYGVIDNALNNLGRVALGISGELNRAHNLGMDLDGNQGGDLFTDINNANTVSNRTIAGTNNSTPSDQEVSVTISDLSKLTTSDYSLTFTGANTYVLTRLSDGKQNAALDPSLTGALTFSGTPPLPSSGTASVVVDGLTIDLTRPSGNFSAGDSFVLQPTRGFSNDIAVQFGRAESLALASPVRTITGSNNTGTASISAGEVTNKALAFSSPTAKQLAPPVVIQFTDPATVPVTYNILDNTNPAAPVALVPAQAGLSYPPTSPNGILPTSFGFQVEISGAPAPGDTFSVDYNTGGVLDNRVGLALTKVQGAGLLNNGKLTAEAAYGVFTQEVGSRTGAARRDVEASQVLLAQSQGLQQSVSGVNLDEEAASLIEFEQAYNASAQVISIARSIFDTLMSAVR